jgi:hypothetical protein
MNNSSEPNRAAEEQPAVKSMTIAGHERSTSPSPKEPTKTKKVLSLLKRPEGATLNELVEATGWLPHTTRAALTGLKKKYVVERTKRDGVSRYTIVQAASC